MVMEQSSVKVGDRVESDGYYGTVRYIGAVPPTKGEWLGVDWDNPERGKHDGSHDGHHYFKAAYPTSGSFVRIHKVQTGCAFLDALRERYGLIDDQDAGVETEEMYVCGSRRQKTTVEVVGAKSVNIKQSHLDELREVGLREMLIKWAGPEGEILRTASNVAELDVSKNLLPSWDEITHITQQLPHLKVLNVSDNLLPHHEDSAKLASSFSHLRTLFINRVGYSWQDLLDCAPMWPVLEVLHACYNRISQLSDPTPCLQHLLLLNLEGNPIRDWNYILQLGHLKNLGELILNSTGLSEVSFPDCSPDGITEYFPSLHTISLSDNNITQWKSIDELNKLPKLEDLKIRKNPLVQETDTLNEATIRSLLIAKIQHLRICNRTQVDLVERKGSELDYLKKFGLEWKKAGGHQDPAKNHPSDAFHHSHPRYQQLLNRYGAPEDSELVVTTSALKNTLISVNIICLNVPDKPVLKKKLPGSMTVQKVRAMLQRIYKADADTTQLYYTTEKMGGRQFEFDNDLRELSYYAIADGDTIHISW